METAACISCAEQNPNHEHEHDDKHSDGDNTTATAASVCGCINYHAHKNYSPVIHRDKTREFLERHDGRLQEKDQHQQHHQEH